MSIENITWGQIKQINSMFALREYGDDVKEHVNDVLSSEFIGRYVIIRTYSAGVFAGVVYKKDKDEIILNEARRLYHWHAKQSISLSAVAKYGILQEESKISAPIDKHWVMAIEIIPCSKEAEKSIRGAAIVEAR